MPPAQTNAESVLRTTLLEMLEGGSAHAGFDQAVEGLAPEFRGRKASACPHTAWRLVEHLRLAQEDILAFTRDGRHQSPKWPDGYWPAEDAPPSEAAWNDSLARFQADHAAMVQLIGNESTRLLEPIPHAKGQTPAREAMLLVDHNAYHIGQLILLRQALGAWDFE